MRIAGFLIVLFSLVSIVAGQSSLSCKYSSPTGELAYWAANGEYQNLSGASDSCGKPGFNANLNTKFRFIIWNPGDLSMFIRGTASDSLIPFGYDSHCGWTAEDNKNIYFGGPGCDSCQNSPPCVASIKNVMLNGVRQVPTKRHLWTTSAGTSQMVFSFKTSKGDTLYLDNPENFQWMPEAGYQVRPATSIKPRTKRQSAIVKKLMSYDLLGRDYFKPLYLPR